MSYIIYYSNFCNHSKKLVKDLSKSQISENIHFICIDNRTKENDKIYIVLNNNQKIILPECINRVPALMNLKDFSVYFGEDIGKNLENQQKEITKVATQNNLEPMAFSFGFGLNGVTSDNYSFLDTPSEDLKATGNGGIRQLHQYFKYDQNDIITKDESENYKSKNSEKLPKNLTVEQLENQREMELKNN